MTLTRRTTIPPNTLCHTARRDFTKHKLRALLRSTYASWVLSVSATAKMSSRKKILLKVGIQKLRNERSEERQES